MRALFPSCWILPGLLLLGACGGEGSEAKRIYAETRGVLERWETRDGKTEDLPATLPALEIPRDSWVTTDPLQLRVDPEERAVYVDSLGGACGGAGVVVRVGKGSFQIRWRLHLKWLDFKVRFRLGMVLLGGIRRQGPWLELVASNDGGEGFRRQEMALEGRLAGFKVEKKEVFYPGLSPQAFQPGDTLNVTLTYDAGSARVEAVLANPSIRDPQVRVAIAGFHLPEGLYLLGVLASGDHRGPSGPLGGMEASVWLREARGDLAFFGRDDPQLPVEFRRILEVSSPEKDPDPFRRAAALLSGNGLPWDRTRRRLAPLLAFARSFGLDRPSLKAWFDQGLLRRGRGGRDYQELLARWMLGPILWAMQGHPALVDDRLHLRRAQVDLSAPGTWTSMEVAARSLPFLFFHRGSKGWKEALEGVVEAFHLLPCNLTARALIASLEGNWKEEGLSPDGLRIQEESRESLEKFLLEDPVADPTLGLRLARLAKEPEERRKWLSWTLEHGLCSLEVGREARKSGVQELVDRWRDLRRSGVRGLTAAVRRLRWMGLEKAAADSAVTLVSLLFKETSAEKEKGNERVLEVLRAGAKAAAPALLAGGRAEILARLLQDAELGKAARRGLVGDPVLPEYYPGLIGKYSGR